MGGYTPTRSCAGCGKRGDKDKFLRIAAPKEGTVFFDPSGKAGGRGVYLCRSLSCLERARKKKAFSRRLKAAVTEEVYARVAEEIEGIGEG